MKNLFEINQSEKNRILEMHENATKKMYLSELITPLDPNRVPFKNKQEGNEFRLWVNTKYPDWAKKNQLDKSGSFNNSYITKAWKEFGTMYIGVTGKFGYALGGPNFKTKISGTKQINQVKTNKEPSFMEKSLSFCANPVKRIKDFVSSIDLPSLSPLPPHFRAFIRFLLGRTEPITAKFFKPEEFKLISDKINSYFPSNEKCKRDKKCFVSLYSDTDFSKVKTGEERVLNVSLAKSIGLTIGNGQIIDKGNSYVLKDIYDFNNFQKNPDAYSPEKATGTIKEALKKLVCGNFIQGVEELASFKQAAGYKGIPVEIEIPKIS